MPYSTAAESACWILFQIKEGDVLYVAGGLMVEHPLTSPFVEAMVSFPDRFLLCNLNSQESGLEIS